VQKVIDWFGGRAQMARSLGVSRVAITQWAKAGGLPPRRAIQIEALTHGELRAVDIIRGGQDDEQTSQ